MPAPFKMAVNIPALVGVSVFYLLILIVGLIAARKSKSSQRRPDTEDVMLAGRNIGPVVGIVTMTGRQILSPHNSTGKW